jgi:hypothetical protein
MFRIKYASYLGGLIAFWMPGSSYAMIRVSYAVLGFLNTGKIGPRDLCQWTRNNALNRTMVLDVIYITFAWFFELARDHSVEQWPTLASNIQIGEDEVWREGGSSGKATRVFHSIRFQTVVTLSSVGQRVGFQGLKPGSPVRTMLGPILFTSLQFPHIFHIFFILIFSIHFNFFSIFYFCI